MRDRRKFLPAVSLEVVAPNAFALGVVFAGLAGVLFVAFGVV